MTVYLLIQANGRNNTKPVLSVTVKTLNMRKPVFFLLLLTLLSALSIRAQNYKTALGVRLSSNAAIINNAVSAKLFFNKTVALEALLSFDPLAIGGLVEVHKPIGGATGLQLFYGGGLYGAFKGNRNVGAQGVLGLDYKFATIPVNLSVDWKPELNFFNDFIFEPAVIGISARFTLQ
jgi:uncharacterized membrane protein